MQTRAEKAEQLFLQGYACSQAIMVAFADLTGMDTRQAKLVAAPFGGGMGRLRLTCGALTGAFMVLGLLYGNEQPKDTETKYSCYELVRELEKQFRQLHQSSQCGEILQQHTTAAEVDRRGHHQKICHILVRDTARLLAELIGQQTR